MAMTDDEILRSMLLQHASTNNTSSSDLQFQVCMEEYKSLQAAYMSYEGAITNNANVTVTALGAIIALGTLFGFQGFVNLILITPTVFYTLCWAHLRTVLFQMTITSYLKNTLVPQIRSLALNNHPSGQLLSWVDYQQILLRKRARVWNFPILGPLFSLQLGSSIALVIIPIFLAVQGIVQLGGIEYLLIAVNIIVIIYTAIQAWRIFQDSLR
jgi:hypothetical protein